MSFPDSLSQVNEIIHYSLKTIGTQTTIIDLSVKVADGAGKCKYLEIYDYIFARKSSQNFCVSKSF